MNWRSSSGSDGASNGLAKGEGDWIIVVDVYLGS